MYIKSVISRVTHTFLIVNILPRCRPSNGKSADHAVGQNSLYSTFNMFNFNFILLDLQQSKTLLILDLVLRFPLTEINNCVERVHVVNINNFPNYLSTIYTIPPISLESEHRTKNLSVTGMFFMYSCFHHLKNCNQQNIHCKASTLVVQIHLLYVNFIMHKINSSEDF